MMPLMATFSRPRDLGVEAGPELDERGDAAVHVQACRAWAW